MVFKKIIFSIFVCLIEIIVFSDWVEEFCVINCEVVVCFIDSVFFYLVW